jgi:hypothetical protein
VNPNIRKDYLFKDKNGYTTLRGTSDNFPILNKRRKKKRLLFDLNHRLTAADQLTYATLQDLDLVAAYIAVIDLSHFRHLDHVNLQRKLIYPLLQKDGGLG